MNVIKKSTSLLKKFRKTLIANGESVVESKKHQWAKTFILKKKTECTDEISISDVNRHKTSLAIIYMCLKMYCYKCTC